MKDLLYIFIGGGVGSLLRYFIAWLLPKYEQGFPWATFTVNVLGCFIIGILYSQLQKTNIKFNPSLSLLLIVGFCGGFTTFSTLGLESFKMIQQQHFLLLSLYIITSICIGLFAVWFGFKIS